MPEYPVTYGDTEDYKNGVYTDPISWFHNDSTQEGCNSGNNCRYYTGTWECEGFARYAHDRYLHNVAPNSTSYETWFTTYPRSGRRELDSVDVIRNFFSTLNTGDYIRYGNYNDATPDNGMHSIVFVSMDVDGIWVYECNQKYYDDLPAERKDDYAVSDYGCGVHLQYYTFGNIKARYNYALYYVKHNYNKENAVYNNAVYHKVECDHCVGYLLQEHNDIAGVVYTDDGGHDARFDCCGGITYNVPHTDVSITFVDFSRHRSVYYCCNYAETIGHVPRYFIYSDTKHTIRFSCCDGEIIEEHRFGLNANNPGECIYCGYGRTS